MLSCLFYVLFVFLADCGLQNLLALHDADVDDKACNLVECDAQPDKEYVPFQNIGHQQSQRDADQPDAYKGNDHRGVFIAGGKQRFAQDARQVLRDLDEAHDEHIDNTNLLNIGVVGHHRHKDTRHQNQRKGGKDADDRTQPDVLLKVAAEQVGISHSDADKVVAATPKPNVAMPEIDSACNPIW